MALAHDLCPMLNAGVKLEKLPLTPQEGFVLSRVTGLSPVSRIIAETGLPAGDVEAALEKLAKLGAVSFQKIEAATPRSKAAVSAAPRGEVKATGVPDIAIILERVGLMYRSLGKLDHYKLLGVPRTADDDQLKSAYAALSREIHPDRFFKMELGTKRDQLDTVFARVSEAYDVLRDPVRRQAYDKSLLPPSARHTAAAPPPGQHAPGHKPSITAGADRMLQLGEQELRAGNYASALQNFKVAAALAPGDQAITARFAFVEGMQSLIASLEKINADPNSTSTLLGDKGIAGLITRIKKDKEQFPVDERILTAAVNFLLHFDHDAKTARELAEKLVRRAPRAPFYILLGRVCERESNPQEALRNYEKALSLDAGNGEAKDAIRNLKRR